MIKISKTLQRLIIGVVSLLVLLVLFQPDIPFVMSISENAIWIIFALIVFSFFALVIKNTSLVYLGMFSAFILTLFLKGLSNENLMFHARDVSSSSLHVMHFNIFEIEDSRESLIKKIVKSDPDIISCEELTPDWNEFLTRNLKDKYPNIISINQFNYDGKIVFSKFEFIEKDTFYLSGHPQLDVSVRFNNSPVNLLFSYVLPHSMNGENAGNKYQLDDLADYISNKKKKPLLIIGEFNQVYWSKNIRDFLYNTKLNNARRSVSFAVRNPYDHIFYSKGIKCVELDEIFDVKANHIGIEGRFRVSRF